MIVQYWHDRKWYEVHKADSLLREATPELRNTFEYYEMTREEKIFNNMKKQSYMTRVVNKDLPDLG